MAITEWAMLGHQICCYFYVHVDGVDDIMQILFGSAYHILLTLFNSPVIIHTVMNKIHILPTD